MDKAEFESIKRWLSIFPKLFRADTNATAEEKDSMWYETFRNYPYATIRDAIDTYTRTAANPEPTPKDILMRIPKGDPLKGFNRLWGKTGERDESGREKEGWLLQCQRCRDLGIVTWYDAGLRMYGEPCDCPAGNHFYTGRKKG